MPNEKPMYVVQFEEGAFWCGYNQWDKQLRKAKVFHSLKFAKDIVSRYKEYSPRILEISMNIIGEVST